MYFGAIRFKNQAMFNPRKYIKGLTKKILENNGQIFENSKVVTVKETTNGYEVCTEKGKVNAKYVVIATHYPVINAPGFYFLKMYQEMSYAIGIETENELFDGMYISYENPNLSFRTAEDDGRKIVIVGGMSHRVGAKIDLEDAYKELEKVSKEIYKDSKILYKWCTQDCVTLDKIPYVGEFSNIMKNIYVATGYKKWGMTTSNVAANIITDKILGKENKYDNLYKSTRLRPIKNRWELGEMIKETTNSLIINKFKDAKETIEDVKKGEGKIVEIDNEKVGVYKDEDGKIYKIKPVCTHLGCELSWNNLEKTWDCPCHGSRFDYKGNLIYEPAIENLEIKLK